MQNSELRVLSLTCAGVFPSQIGQVDAREVKQVRILHKDTEGINGFCVNKVSVGSKGGGGGGGTM